MHSIGIATDSHSGISPQDAEALGIRVLPMPFTINGENYLEGVTVSREEFFAYQQADADIATSQPAPTDVLALWDEMLATYDEILYLPISSGLSGSCGAAMALAEEEPYAGRVFVVDIGRVSVPLRSAVTDAVNLVRAGHSAAEVREILERTKDDMVIYVAVQTLQHLKKGGRISPTVAAVGTLLHIKPILHLSIGLLEPFKNCRGFTKAREAMIEAVRHDLDTRFSDAHLRGDLHLMAASSASAEETASWVAEIEAAFPGMPVTCDYLSLGVSCHTGEGALGIGLCCSPRP
ncbi:MAG: DegV family protein [Christensenellaceae bacterium]|nr:DegV family protein [Christensenellaceae bacterium]